MSANENLVSGLERRASARSRVFMLVNVGAERMWAVDIGLGGLQCRSASARLPGTYVDLAFTLPETRERIEARGQVVSIAGAGQSSQSSQERDTVDGEYEIGIRFCDVSGWAVQAIYRFMDARRTLWSRRHQVGKLKSPHLRAVAALDQPFSDLLEEARRTLRERPAPNARSGVARGHVASFAAHQPSPPYPEPNRFWRQASSAWRAMTGVFRAAA